MQKLLLALGVLGFISLGASAAVADSSNQPLTEENLANLCLYSYAAHEFATDDQLSRWSKGEHFRNYQDKVKTQPWYDNKTEELFKKVYFDSEHYPVLDLPLKTSVALTPYDSHAKERNGDSHPSAAYQNSVKRAVFTTGRPLDLTGYDLSYWMEESDPRYNRKNPSKLYFYFADANLDHKVIRESASLALQQARKLQEASVAKEFTHEGGFDGVDNIFTGHCIAITALDEIEHLSFTANKSQDVAHESNAQPAPTKSKGLKVEKEYFYGKVEKVLMHRNFSHNENSYSCTFFYDSSK